VASNTTNEKQVEVAVLADLREQVRVERVAQGMPAVPVLDAVALKTLVGILNGDAT
jgi:hypothetical protein